MESSVCIESITLITARFLICMGSWLKRIERLGPLRKIFVEMNGQVPQTSFLQARPIPGESSPTGKLWFRYHLAA